MTLHAAMWIRAASQCDARQVSHTQVSHALCPEFRRQVIYLTPDMLLLHRVRPDVPQMFPSLSHVSAGTFSVLSFFFSPRHSSAYEPSAAFMGGQSLQRFPCFCGWPSGSFSASSRLALKFGNLSKSPDHFEITPNPKIRHRKIRHRKICHRKIRHMSLTSPPT